MTAALGNSLTLMGVSLAVAVLLALALSAATLRRGAARRIVRVRAGVGAAVLAALPEFLLAAVLATVFAVHLGWFPALGWGAPDQLVLPALAMGVPAGALLGKLLDDALPGAFAEPWARAAAASGMPGRTVARHALRRTLPALLPQLGLVVVGLTGGAVAVETLYAVPGLGGTALAAALAQDLPVLQATVLVLLLLGVAAGLLARLAVRVLLGPALTERALPALVAPRLPGRRSLTAAALVLGLLLVAVTVAGLLRDPLHVDTAARLAVRRAPLRHRQPRPRRPRPPRPRDRPHRAGRRRRRGRHPGTRAPPRRAARRGAHRDRERAPRGPRRTRRRGHRSPGPGARPPPSPPSPGPRSPRTPPPCTPRRRRPRTSPPPSPSARTART